MSSQTISLYSIQDISRHYQLAKRVLADIRVFEPLSLSEVVRSQPIQKEENRARSVASEKQIRPEFALIMQQIINHKFPPSNRALTYYTLAWWHSEDQSGSRSGLQWRENKMKRSDFWKKEPHSKHRSIAVIAEDISIRCIRAPSRNQARFPL